MTVETIASRDNPRLKRLRRLVADGAAYRRDGRVWIEGDHLCGAMLARGRQPETVVCTQAGLAWVGAQQAAGRLDHQVTVGSPAVTAAGAPSGAKNATAGGDSSGLSHAISASVTCHTATW